MTNPGQEESLRPFQETLPVLNSSVGPTPGNQAAVPPPPMDVAGLTDVGQERKVNEDHYLIADLERSIRVRETTIPTTGSSHLTATQGTMLVVADGIGGHGHGDIASAVTLDTLLGHVFRFMPWFSVVDQRHDAEMLAAFEGSLDQLQLRVEQVAERRGLTESRMGTTLTVAYVVWPALLVVHVGDSRCYRMRQGVLSRLTADQTVGADLRRRGADESVAEQYDKVLTSAVGADHKRPVGEVHRHRLAVGDTLLVCSDGLTAHVTDEEIRAVLAGAQSSRAACGALVTLANSNGGTDNITAVVLRC